MKEVFPRQTLGLTLLLTPMLSFNTQEKQELFAEEQPEEGPRSTH